MGTMKTVSRTATVVLLTTALYLVGTTLAFTTPGLHRTATTTTRAITLVTPIRQELRSTTTRLNLVPPNHEHVGEVTNMLAAAEVFFQHHNTQWLADAAAAAPEPANEVGWWGQYINLFKVALEFMHGLIDQPLRSIGIEQTWGPAIALFTMSMRSLLIPLSIQQNKSAEYMKILKPYVKEISEKYKNNENAKNQAVGRLYQDAEQNPLAGCLTSLAQLPIFLGLYRGVRELAIAGELNEPFLWIPSLEGPTRPPDYRDLDWLTSGWHTVAGSSFPEPLMGWETTLAFLLMPVLLVVLQSSTMQVLQPPVDADASAEEKKQMESTQTVLKFLPLMIGFFSLQVPAGLTIYWVTTNLFTLTQSLAVRAYFKANPPKINLPDYWDSVVSGNVEDLTPEERRAAASAGLRVGPTLEELQQEARFHVLVERGNQSIRDTSPAWERVQRTNGSAPLPSELMAWVQTAAVVTRPNDMSRQAEHHAQENAAVSGVSEEHAPTSSESTATTEIPFFVKSS